MSDYLPDTPYLARAYCPGCEPDTDPTQGVLEVRYCEPHLPSRDGTSDRLVSAASYLGGGSEAGGDDNRAWCNILHRGR